jgi:hypothetical protein
MPGMKKSPRPTPNPRRSGPVSRGNAASRRQQSEQDDVLKNGGRGMKAGGKVKKMRAGGGSMSSQSLRGRITDDSLARDRNTGRTYADRGTVGNRKADEEVDREIREYVKDLNLIETYGRDAPNARSFNTRRATGAPSAKKAAGGKVKKMQAGGKCRGMGAATRGGNFSRG